MNGHGSYETTLVALDVETKCNRPGCSAKRCDHALIPHYAAITVVGVWSPTVSRTFRSLPELSKWLSDNPSTQFVGHNFKYDLKVLHANGIDIDPERWLHDTSLMATASYEKVPAEWLEQYERQRKTENKKLPQGYSHRTAGRHSLKTLAPYFLDVPAFWEDPSNHDNDEYVLKDCEYTWKLCQFFIDHLKRIDCEKIYNETLLPSSKMFLAAEKRGVRVDFEAMRDVEAEAIKTRDASEAKLKEHWAEPFAYYEEMQRQRIASDYDAKCESYYENRIKNKTPETWKKTQERYEAMKLAALDKVESLSIASPSQLKWLLKDYYKLPIKDFKGDESTGREVLEELAGSGREDIKELLTFRKWNKLITSYFPTWRDLEIDGCLRPAFHLDVTRTGRTSCSKPNLQQVTSSLKGLFVARKDHVLITKDLSGIEPAVIAYLTEDPRLCEVLINNENFHGYCAKIFFPYIECGSHEVKKHYGAERGCTKTGDLSAFYGTGSSRLQSVFLKNGFPRSESEVKRMLTNYRSHFSGVFDYKKRLDVMAKTKPIPAMFGYKRSFVDDHDNIYMKNFNGQVQVSASLLLLQGALRIQKACDEKKLRAQPILWVHDEVVVEAHKDDAEETEKIMNSSMTDFKLTTAYGDIPLAVEGAVSEYWEK